MAMYLLIYNIMATELGDAVLESRSSAEAKPVKDDVEMGIVSTRSILLFKLLNEDHSRGCAFRIEFRRSE